ncbi:hypothetical protein DSBG_1949 [Desulfosporosinus sp. BG]|nr:hypothetical protein DSBG_1949 [Desulfosporosinus sp. BG]
MGVEGEEIMFDFIIAYMAVAVITVASRSIQEDVILSLLVLLPTVWIKIVYTRTKYKKMGEQLVNLDKTPSVLPGMRASSVIFTLFAFFIVMVSYYGKFRIGISWLILLALQLLYGQFMENTLNKGLMNNGIWTGNRLINWSAIQSYKWMGTKEGYSTLKIEYIEYYSFHTTVLKVTIKQKEEVDGLFKKMVKV